MRWKLKIACLRAGKSQRRVARESGITENRFSEIVNAWINPRPDEQLSILTALGPSHDDSLFDVEPDDRLSGLAEARSR